MSDMTKYEGLAQKGKQCIQCLVVFSPLDLHFFKSKSKYYSSRCKKCCVKKNREYRSMRREAAPLFRKAESKKRSERRRISRQDDHVRILQNVRKSERHRERITSDHSYMVAIAATKLKSARKRRSESEEVRAKQATNDKRNALKRKKRYREDHEYREAQKEKARDSSRRRMLCPEYRLRYTLKRRKAISRRRNRCHRSRVSASMSESIRKAMKEGKAGRRWENFVDYDLAELMKHLERQFTSRMSWSNYGAYWHIDHIIPVSSYVFDSVLCDAFKACWSLSNLRPLEAKKNLMKGASRQHLL